MKKVYDQLNKYLNDIFIYLEKESPFLLERILDISKLNDEFLKFLSNNNLNNMKLKTVQNNLTFEDVCNLAREIIEHIDESYLEDFDKLIQYGLLDFDYEGSLEDSTCTSYIKNGEVIRQVINIDRKFNYEDVRSLVHEFIHYTNGKKISLHGTFFGEFLSIYFELFAIDYLLKKGINKNEIDYLLRIKNAKTHSSIFYQYEIVLLAYTKFGHIDENTLTLLKEYFLDVSQETFEKECSILCKNLSRAEEKYKNDINAQPNSCGYFLAKDFIDFNYKYIIGTILAFYAYKHCNLTDIVNLNNHINDLEGKTIEEICLSIGIDLNAEDFLEKVFDAIIEFTENKENDFHKGTL